MHQSPASITEGDGKPNSASVGQEATSPSDSLTDVKSPSSCLVGLPETRRKRPPPESRSRHKRRRTNVPGGPASAADAAFQCKIVAGTNLHMGMDPATTLFVGTDHVGGNTHFLGVGRVCAVGKKYVTVQHVECDLEKVSSETGPTASSSVTLVRAVLPIRASDRHSRVSMLSIHRDEYDTGKLMLLKSKGGSGCFESWEPWLPDANGSYQPLTVETNSYY